MLRTASASALRNSVVRAARPSTSALGCRAATTHAISNPTLANIEKRWEALPEQEQADLWMALRDRMKENWADLTVQEKKAGEWITAPCVLDSLEAATTDSSSFLSSKGVSSECQQLIWNVLSDQLMDTELGEQERASPLAETRRWIID